VLFDAMVLAEAGVGNTAAFLLTGQVLQGLQAELAAFPQLQQTALLALLVDAGFLRSR
jgi:hypothetical protein